MSAVLPNTITGAPLSGLARALVQASRLSPGQADALHKKAAADKTPFIDALLESAAAQPKPVRSGTRRK